MGLNEKIKRYSSHIKEQRANFLAYSFTDKGKMSNVVVKDSRILCSNSNSYQVGIGTNGGLWWDAPAAEQIENVSIWQDGAAVDSIRIEME